MSSGPITTHKHIARVRELLGAFAIEMILRGDRHDASKFDPVEMNMIQSWEDMIERNGPAEFGSGEYERRLSMIAPMLEHHHANNSHHPEHFANGIAGMDLADLVEMFCDWKAASERNGSTTFDVELAIEKYGVEPQLASILRNTAERYSGRQRGRSAHDGDWPPMP